MGKFPKSGYASVSPGADPLLVSPYGGPQLSRQNQKPHGKNKIPHGKTKNLTAKTKNLTAKTKYLTAKTKTSRQNQMLHSKSKITLVLPWVIAFAVRYLVRFCCEVFGFAVSFLVLSWGILFLPWGFRFCSEVFGLPWGILFLPWGFWFCRDSCGLP